MIDPFGRDVTYLRVSVTDRCDLRCVYCMSEDMTFLPRRDLLSLEELDRVCSAFVSLGVRKIRITGGEPLVRRDVLTLFQNLGRHLKTGALDEITLTTNGNHLAKHAVALYEAGVRRINVSLDTLDADRFRALTRWGKIETVLEGIRAAKAAGLKVKINTVALKETTADEFDALLAWCGDQGFDWTLIETMPMGEIEQDRMDQYLSLAELRQRLEKRWTLRDSNHQSGGPARYVDVEETGGRVGFIEPLSHNFCESCNRVRLTCTGRLYMCLGQDDWADLRTPVRKSDSDGLLAQAICEAIGRKPKGHDFVIDRRDAAPALRRHMSTTGG